VFTSGGTQSNLQALLLARDEALAAGADPARLRVLAGECGHFSVQKSAALLGLPAGAVVTVPATRTSGCAPTRSRPNWTAAPAKG